MSIKNKILYIALFFTQATPAFILIDFFQYGKVANSVVLALLALSLLVSWKSSLSDSNKMDKYRNIIVFIGLAIGIFSISSGGQGSGILVIALAMIAGINVSLRDRKMLFYALLFSFMLFLYASSKVFNSYSIVSVVVFTFSFFAVIVADYYNTRRVLQSSYESDVPDSFIGTTLVLMLVVSSFTGILYYFVPQPEAANYGILPFGGKKYTGIAGESKKGSPSYKESISQLPEYSIDADAKAPRDQKPSYNNTIETLNFYTYTKSNSSSSDAVSLKADQKELKTNNRRLFYSSLDRDNAFESSKGSNILFEVTGKEARFLRGQSYDNFNGRKWQRHLNYMYTIDTNNNLYYDGYYRAEPFDNFTITVKGRLAGKPIIYMPLGVLRLQFPTNLFYEDTARTVYAPSQIQEGTFYTTSIRRENYYGYDMIPKPEKYDVWYKQQYLDVPSELDPRITALAQELTKGEYAPLEKAQSIISHFKRNYFYLSAQVSHPLHNQKLENVLFDSQIGNALQFNTALVMMLRSRGVYSRIGFGYAPNEYNEQTHSYIVERKNRAVWSELFVPGIGWVALHAAEDIPFVGEEFANTEKTFMEQAEETAALLFVLMLVISILYYYLRPYAWTYVAKRRLHRYKKNEDVHFVISAYEEVERYYRHFKKGRRYSCTVQEYEAYVKGIKPEHAYVIELLSLYYNQATYQGSLDFDFDKKRYLESSLYLVHHPFRIEPLSSYLYSKVRAIF